MNYRRVLCITELGGDASGAVAVIRQVAPAAELLVVVAYKTERRFPWFSGEGGFPLPAYSEFMPPPRLGRSPFGENDPDLFSDEDPWGWRISEIEEEYELKPGLRHLAEHIVGSKADHIARGDVDQLMLHVHHRPLTLIM